MPALNATIGAMQRRLGVHVSIAGGIDKGLERAVELGCQTVQLFSHNPRGWGFRRRDAEEVRRFRELKKKLDISPVFVHTSYLINLASSQQLLLNKSIDMLVQELAIADEINAEYIVLHTGSASRDLPDKARQRAVSALRTVAQQGKWKAGLLLENTAGERGDITSRLADIAGIIHKAPQGLIAGICIDTCHAFAAGYDIGSRAGLDSLAGEIDEYFGRDMLRLVHLNDSKRQMGSGVDRHEHIGEGAIGKDGFRQFLRHPFFSTVPCILETPKKNEGDDRRNLMMVRKIAGSYRKSC